MVERPESHWIPSVVAFLVVFLLSVIATMFAQSQADNRIQARLELEGQTLAGSTQEAIDLLNQRLRALAGLFEASEHVTGAEYARFVTDLGLGTGMEGMAYMPIIEMSDLEAFEQQMASVIPGYKVFELDPEGNRVSPLPRPIYFPVQYFEPAAALDRPLGLDAGSPPGRLPALLDAIGSGKPTATALVPLATTGEQGFILYSPVMDDSGSVVALVGGPVVLPDLLTARVPRGLAEMLDWTVTDITQTGVSPPAHQGFSYTDIVEVADRHWQFEVTPTAGSALLRERARTYWILIAGVLLGAMAAIGTSALGRRAEAIRRVQVLTDVLNANDRFIATMSHELRTPLTAVLGFAEVLRDQVGNLTADERNELAACIAEEATDLANIIDDLLVMQRAEHGTLTSLAVPVDLSVQTSKVLATMNLEHRIRIEIPRPVSPAIGDPIRVRQILRNLLANAQTYGGPNIRVVIEASGDKVALLVIDDGEGIPNDEVERIFDPYYRAHTSPGKPGSIGLGLSVCRTLARKMGGELTHRRSAGETIFRLILTAAAPTEDQSVGGRVSSKVVSPAS